MAPPSGPARPWDRRRFLALGGAALALLGPGSEDLEAADGALPDDFEEERGAPERLDSPFWERIRRKYFALRRGEVYVNNSTFGATLEPVRRRMEEVQELFSAGCDVDRYVSSVVLSLRPMREAMARVVNSPLPAGAGIGNADSATEGISLVANGLPISRGDVVLVTDHEHTGNRTPWELQRDRRGATLVKVPLLLPGEKEAAWKRALLERFREALAPGDVRVVSFPWITCSTGHVLPAKEICALATTYGAVSVIDAAQAFAVLPVDLVDLDCDFLVANGHKYLCGPIGSGFVCIHPRQLQDPTAFWATVVDDNYYHPDVPGRNFPHRKGGVAPFTNVLPLLEALLFLEALEPARVHARLSFIGSWLRALFSAFPDRFELLTPRSRGLSAVMTCFRMVTGTPSSEEVARRLTEEYGIHAKWVTEGGADAVRLSPHYYTTARELVAIARALCEIAGVDPRGWEASAR